MVDHDADTANTLEDKNKPLERGRWRSLLHDLMNIRAGCQGGAEPLSDQLPGRCSTIQLEALGQQSRCRRGATLFPLHVTETGSTTPAALSVRNACESLRRGERAVVFVAFDGVLDFEAGNATPRAAFVDAIRGCVQNSIHLTIIAAPSRYKYVYILSRPQYTPYSEQLAEALAARWRDSRVSAVSIPTTPHPEKRSARGRFRLERPAAYSHPQWNSQRPRANSVSLPFDTVGRVGYEIDVAGWAVQDDNNHGAQFSVRWEDAEFSHAGLSAGALQFPSALVYANQPISKYFQARDTAVETLPNCADARSMQKRDGCKQPTANVFQWVDLSPGALNVKILKNDLDWVRGQLPIQDLRASKPAPLFAAVVVAPAARVDPCVEALRTGLAGADQWGPTVRSVDRLAAARVACRSSLLRPLGEAMALTPHDPFSTAGGSFVSVKDRRAGLVTLIESLRAVAETQVQTSAMRPCVIGTFRMIAQNCRSGPDRVLPARAFRARP